MKYYITPCSVLRTTLPQQVIRYWNPLKTKRFRVEDFLECRRFFFVCDTARNAECRQRSYLHGFNFTHDKKKRGSCLNCAGGSGCNTAILYNPVQISTGSLLMATGFSCFSSVPPCEFWESTLKYAGGQGNEEPQTEANGVDTHNIRNTNQVSVRHLWEQLT